MQNRTLNPALLAGLVAAAWASLAIGQPVRADDLHPAVRVSISTEDADVRTVLAELFRKVGANFVLDSGVKGRVNVIVRNRPFDDALQAVLEAVTDGPGLTYQAEGGVYRVMPKMPKNTSAEKKENAAGRVERDMQSGSALEPFEAGQAVPSTEWYVIPAAPVAIGGGLRPRMVWQDDTAEYVRVDQVPIDPIWVPGGVAMPAVPVWTGATVPYVQSWIGPRPPDAIGGGMMIRGSVGIGVSPSSHLAAAPGGRFIPGGHFPRGR